MAKFTARINNEEKKEVYDLYRKLCPKPRAYQSVSKKVMAAALLQLYRDPNTYTDLFSEPELQLLERILNPATG